MVSAPTPRASRRAQTASLAAIGKTVLLILVLISLVAAIAGGLVRAGLEWPGHPDGAVAGRAAIAHAALMMSGFLGTVIAIERAVAVKLRWAFAAPFLSGSGGVLLLAGYAGAGAWLGVFAALVFVGVNLVVVKRLPAAHTVLLLAGSLAWLAGAWSFATGQPGAATVPWWFAFLVSTIAAERLEMTRLTRRHPAAQPALHAVLLALLAGAALSAPAPALGGVVYGAALAALAVWLGIFDIARRTVLSRGLSRYIAVCLLGGYLWLGVAGLAWMGMAIGMPTRDAALHALGLGFVISLVMGHAPVILPAVARVRLHYGGWFYVPLALLHASLVLRLAGGLADPELLAAGAALNAVALALFGATVAGSALSGHVRGAGRLSGRTR